MTMFNSRNLSLIAALTLLPSVAFAHPGHDTSGLMAGLLHPLMGWDHLLAMVAVGMLAVMGRQKMAWQLPVAFVSFMLIGALIGISGIAIPAVEMGILISLVALGGLLAFNGNHRMSTYVPALSVCCALFGMLHGNAHGLELPASASAISYISGFTLATIALHLAGCAVARIGVSKWQAIALKTSGVAIAGAGLFGMLSVM